ncbi:MAG: pyridoxal-phosphate dependent enzyme [Roseovarius sp.]|nr:pyridoxal-phosphate dependent enzyme [Roseovarius sp.]
MEYFENSWLGCGLPEDRLPEVPYPSINAHAPLELLKMCPAYSKTPLIKFEHSDCELWIKVESDRMGTGSFKALGASYVIARMALEKNATELPTSLAGETFVTASAGNHGLSVAAGARLFGASSVIFLPNTVPEHFAKRLRSKGARVVRKGDDYETGMTAACKAANDRNWTLLSDSSWPGYFEIPKLLMEGYLAMASEIVETLPERPSHILLQAGVGGMAAACAAFFRNAWGSEPKIVVVEPQAAPALMESARAGQPRAASGPISNMGRLDCKEPSYIALKGLARDADGFAAISDEQASGILPALAKMGLNTTESGGAGVAAYAAMKPEKGSRILCIVSEGGDI